jgi:signal transduction histidine kinase
MNVREESSTITAGIWQMFFLATISLTVFVILLFVEFREASALFLHIRQSERMERVLRSLGEQLLDAETGERGYLLTQSEKFLAPYVSGVSHAKRLTLVLSQLAEEHPSFEKEAFPIKSLVAGELNILALTIHLAEQGQRPEAMAILQSGLGKDLMDQFRRFRTQAIGKQILVLKARRTDYQKTLNNIRQLIVFGGIGVGLLLFLIAYRTASRLKEPVDNLLKGIMEISRGRLDKRIPIAANDEIGHLAKDINLLAERLQKAHKTQEAMIVELKRSNDELDSFAYVASHDLKAPLRGIRNLADWIEEDVRSIATPEVLKNLALLQNRADRLERLLTSLLDYSRIGRKQASIERVDSCKLIAEIVQYLAIPSGFTVSCEGEMPTFETVKAPFEQVLRNLIQNAITHHDRKEGHVTVSSRNAGDKYEFEVADDGPGIPPEFHQKIFEMFQTLKPRDQVEGSGMGLTIVRKTVNTVGGTVSVESSPPIRGTRFRFTWPKEISQNTVQ